MNLNELFTDTPIDEKQIWAKSGQKVVRKYRCTSGARKGRIVAKPGQCFAAPNIKARFNMKRTRARVGKKMVRLAKRTKRTNPASRRVKAMNRTAGTQMNINDLLKEYQSTKETAKVKRVVGNKIDIEDPDKPGVTTTVDTDKVNIDTDDQGNIEVKDKDTDTPAGRRKLRPGASVKFNNENK